MVHVQETPKSMEEGVKPIQMGSLHVKKTLNEYVDVALCDHVTYNVDDICKIVTDSQVVSVVRKMQEVV